MSAERGLGGADEWTRNTPNRNASRLLVTQASKAPHGLKLSPCHHSALAALLSESFAILLVVQGAVFNPMSGPCRAQL